MAAESSTATDSPTASHRSNSSTHEVAESILLDTAGGASLLAVTVRTTGEAASQLREQVARLGREKFEQERLDYFVKRYATAKRVGRLQHRDDPESNEFVMVEVFEVQGFLAKHSEPNLVTFSLPRTLVVEALKLPPKMEGPLRVALPYPCSVTHTFEVQSPSLQPMAAPRLNLRRPYLEFSRRQKSVFKYWSVTLNLSTLSDAVPPNLVGAHGKLVEQISQESTWTLSMPRGVARPRQPHDFGRLPPAKKLPAAGPATPETPPVPAFLESPVRGESLYSTARHSFERSESATKRRPKGSMRTRHLLLLAIVSLSVLILFYIIFFMLGVRTPW